MMLPLILAQSEYETLEQTFQGRLYEGLLLMGVGMLVVFTALLVIGELIRLMGYITREKPEVAEAVEPSQAPQSMETAAFAAPAATGPTAPADGRIEPRTLAILAAAAAVMVGGSVRVRRVTRVQQQGAGSAWTGAGRMELQTSHNVRR